MAQPRRAPGAAADAAGDDQPRPDQLQHADQQPLRQPRQRRGAGGDRQGVPHLPAAAGDLLGGDRDRALPDPGPLRRPRRDREPAGDDGQRDAPDPLRPGPRRGRGAGPLRADDPPRLPARRIRPPSRRRWSRRPSSGSPSRCRPTASTCSRPGPSSASSGPGWRPASPASTWSSRPSPPSPSTSPSASAASSPATGIGDDGRVVAQAWSCAASSTASSSGGCSRHGDQDHDRVGRPGRGRFGRLGRARRRARARPGRPDRLARRRASASAASTYLGLAQAAADRRARADHAARCAAARCSAPVATCWASPRSSCSSASPGSGRRRCAGACCPSFAGAPAHLATAVLALALLIWVAEVLGTVGLFEAGAVSGCRGRCGARSRALMGGAASLRLAGGSPGESEVVGGRARARKAGRPCARDRTRRPARRRPDSDCPGDRGSGGRPFRGWTSSPSCPQA